MDQIRIPVTIPADVEPVDLFEVVFPLELFDQGVFIGVLADVVLVGRRQRLAGLFWSGYLESSARANLRHALSKLRQVLRDKEHDQPFILVEGETIQLNPSSNYQLDIERFETLITQEKPDLTLLDRLECAAELYQGGFLVGFSLKDCPEFDTWISLWGEELQRKALNVFSLLAEEYEKRGELEKACQSTRRQLELEPSLEQAHWQLMRRLALRGQRTAALVQFEKCEQILGVELGVKPAPATVQLYERIKKGELDKIDLAHQVQTLQFYPPTSPISQHKQPHSSVASMNV